MTIDEIITNIIRVEGSAYTNDSRDSGGPTRYGITLATLSAYRGRPCTAADVQALTEPEARAIYLTRYVSAPGFSRVIPLSARIADELVDTGVNAGPARAAVMLQRCLNALNRQGKDYPDIPVDGDCGPATVAALKAFLSKRGKEGETVLLRALNCLQGEFYIDLAERRPKDEVFLLGWLLNRVTI
jgi:lysozyme family protein